MGTSDLFFIKNTSDTFVLVRSKIGVRASDSESKDLIYGSGIIKSTDRSLLITFSRNGALYRVKTYNHDTQCADLMPEKLMGYICGHCLTLLQDNHKLARHVSSQHLGPVKCKMCKAQFRDTQQLQMHVKMCSFPCGVEGCTEKHKMLIYAIRHKRKFLKSMK